MRNSQRIANANAFNAEQVHIFNQVAQMHQLEYKCHQAVEAKSNAEDAVMEDAHGQADLIKIKKLLDSFTLDGYGRGGLQLEADEEIAVQNGKTEFFPG